MIANSLTRAMLRSLCVFSITLAASATLIDGAKWVPAEIMDKYKPLISSAASGVEPDVTFLISGKRWV